MARKTKLLVLFVLALSALVVTLFVPPVPQDPAYHNFADVRTLLGIPNFWNVVSNLPFLFVGLAGLLDLNRRTLGGCLTECRTAYRVFFIGVVLVCAGSGFYHWAPTNESLVWDRLPMAISFMAFFSAILSENLSAEVGRRMLAPLVTAGVLSVVYWAWTEQAGGGDLRPYALVQFLPMLLLPLILLLFRSPFKSNFWIWFAMLAYGLAKVLEFGDTEIYEFMGVSGHTLKHLAAAAGAWLILIALRRREIV